MDQKAMSHAQTKQMLRMQAQIMKYKSSLEQKELELAMKPAEVAAAVKKSEAEKMEIKKEIEEAEKEKTKLNTEMQSITKKLNEDKIKLFQERSNENKLM